MGAQREMLLKMSLIISSSQIRTQTCVTLRLTPSPYNMASLTIQPLT